MEPAKQAKIMQEFQRQSAQMDMTVSAQILHECILSVTSTLVFEYEATNYLITLCEEAIFMLNWLCLEDHYYNIDITGF